MMCVSPQRKNFSRPRHGKEEKSSVMVDDHELSKSQDEDACSTSMEEGSILRILRPGFGRLDKEDEDED